VERSIHGDRSIGEKGLHGMSLVLSRPRTPGLRSTDNRMHSRETMALAIRVPPRLQAGKSRRGVLVRKGLCASLPLPLSPAGGQAPDRAHLPTGQPRDLCAVASAKGKNLSTGKLFPPCHLSFPFRLLRERCVFAIRIL